MKKGTKKKLNVQKIEAKMDISPEKQVKIFCWMFREEEIKRLKPSELTLVKGALKAFASIIEPIYDKYYPENEVKNEENEALEEEK